VREEFVKPQNLGLVRVARDSAEALRWIEDRRDTASLNYHVCAEKTSELTP